ncbi:SMN complex subunit Gem7 [Schizosaccharomyces osmophilus]|uniref:SMN complex subunit Gem7 n=1 Tax=Schizosaccharomyces osmophilus TaxID=2545709 RepID=A0AAE9WG07_9SCHI|nr:SMN complex subunit Gem7 [Schizosaccharomyces osmophilus]WBW74979.1 SMN complex subunit Gem7 [Schizosaccharomyces osmophilus]
MVDVSDNSLAFQQRMRTLRFYRKMSSSTPAVVLYLHDQKELQAEFSGIDSSESKVAVSHLHTDWGIVDKAVVRAGDIANIEYILQQEEGEI